MSLKKLNFFFFKYNSTLNTNYLYFTIPVTYLKIIIFFYQQGLVNFYKIEKNVIFVYLTKQSKKHFKFRSWNTKHKKIFHSVKKVSGFNWYLTSLGFMSGSVVQKLNYGGRLLYTQ